MSEFVALLRHQQQDVRAAQRTFEGAYLRTALGKVTFGLLIMRLFSRDFLPIGVLFVVSAILNLVLTLQQRQRNERVLISEPSTTFETNGGFVAILTTVDLASYITLLVLLNVM